jgi:hypothetical protein
MIPCHPLAVREAYCGFRTANSILYILDVKLKTKDGGGVLSLAAS